jgi:hypothetical protein
MRALLAAPTVPAAWATFARSFFDTFPGGEGAARGAISSTTRAPRARELDAMPAP